MGGDPSVGGILHAHFCLTLADGEHVERDHDVVVVDVAYDPPKKELLQVPGNPISRKNACHSDAVQALFRLSNERRF